MPEWEPACRLRAVALSNLGLINPSQDVEEVLSGVLKITQRAMIKRRNWVNIAVCPCLHPSLTHHRDINPFENKVWEIHIFIKNCVCSFIEVCRLCLIMFPLVCEYTTQFHQFPACVTKGWLLQTSFQNWNNVVKKICQQPLWGEDSVLLPQKWFLDSNSAI